MMMKGLREFALKGFVIDTVWITRPPLSHSLSVKIYQYIPPYQYTVPITRPGPRPLLCTSKEAQYVLITRHTFIPKARP